MEEPAASSGRINTLILGVDNDENAISRADTIMFISADVNTREVSIISIPRDTRVNIEGVGLTKINHANAVGVMQGGVQQGTTKSLKAVSDLLGVTINYYVKVNFQGFEEAVDAVGGIDMNLPYAVSDDSANAHFSAGLHHLSGEEALCLARARYSLPNGDFDRQFDQYLLLSALAEKMLSLSNIPALPKELEIIHQNIIDTNLTIPEMLTMGLAFKEISKDTIKYYQLPGKGIKAKDPLVGAEVYYYELDKDSTRKVVREAIGMPIE